MSPGIAEIVLFGGSTAIPPKLHTFIAETTVLKFGKYSVCMIRLIKALVCNKEKYVIDWLIRKIDMVRRSSKAAKLPAIPDSTIKISNGH